MRKFLFDRNDFNDDAPEEQQENLPPPPPVFSEAELEAARAESYAQGKKDGLREAESSREKAVASLVAAIERKTATLFSSENARIRQYEAEAVMLARSIFTTLFPVLNGKHGLDEIMHVIDETISNNRTRPEIVIEVHPDFALPVSTALDPVSHSSALRVSGNPLMEVGECLLTWNDGGASRRPQRIAGQIENLLKEVLADRPRLPDNGEGTENRVDEAPPDTETQP